MVKTGSSLGSLLTAVTGLKHEARETSSLAHACTMWVVIRNSLLAPSCLTASSVWTMTIAGVHVPGAAGATLPL